MSSHFKALTTLSSRRSCPADIFRKSWVPQDADVIQCYVPSSKLETSFVGSHTSFVEARIGSVDGIEWVKNAVGNADLVVLLVFQTPTSANVIFWYVIYLIRVEMKMLTFPN